MCPLCKSENYKLIGIPRLDEKSKKILKQNYKIVQCSDCRFYFINPKIDLTPSDWQYLYNEEYFHEYTQRHKKRREKDRKQRLKKLTQLSSGETKNFLDIGCGEGLMLLEAANQRWNVFGIDITDNRVEEARKSDISFKVTDLLDVELPGSYFDCIYCDSVLEHILNPIEYLEEVHRLLKPGGVAYIGVPNEDYLLNDVKMIVNRISGNSSISAKLKPFVSPYHIGGFNKNSLLFALNNTSFEIELLRNFASRLLFMEETFLSKEFFKAVILSSIFLMAVPLRREYYFEVYARKR